MNAVRTLLILLFALPTGALANEPEAHTGVSVGGHFLTLLHARSDSDFDPSPRYFDPDGQSEGQSATFFQPHLSARPGGGVEVFYEAELGWNVWSRHATGQPNSFHTSQSPGLSLRHRQLWAEWRASEHVRVRAGYQNFQDPSRLLLDHQWGAIRVDLDWEPTQTTLWIGQLPDSTYEGLDVRSDNFVTDSLFLGAQTAITLGELKVDLALYLIGDHRVIDHPLHLGSALAGIRYESDTVQAWLHALTQVGTWFGSGAAGVDQSIFTWAVQAGVRHQVGAFHWSSNVVALSADDDHDGNDVLGAFFASGKNNSPSTMLTEDEHRDRYDNIDERIGTTFGAFSVNRAGLVVADLALGYQVASWYEPRLVTAAGLTINPANALDQRFVGLEISLLNRFPVSEYATFYLNAQCLLPGRAAAAFTNDVDRNATQIVYGGQLGFLASF